MTVNIAARKYHQTNSKVIFFTYNSSFFEITNLLSEFIVLFGSWQVCFHNLMYFTVFYRNLVLSFKKRFSNHIAKPLWINAKS
jgi:hypothetical protein